MHPYLSIVIPAYNEEKRIAKTLTHAIHFLLSKPYNTEILVVDDGSRDATIAVVAEIVAEMTTEKVTVRVLPLRENRGRGFAVRMGMIASRGARVLLMDADASVSIETLDHFMKEMDMKDHDVLVGSLLHPMSTEKERTEFYRKPLRRMAWMTLKVLFDFPVRDTQRPFKLFTREAVHGIFYRCTLERWGIDIEIIAIATALGFQMKEMPIAWDNPAGSKVSLKSYWHTFLEAVRVYRRQRTRVYGMTTLHYS